MTYQTIDQIIKAERDRYWETLEFLRSIMPACNDSDEEYRFYMSLTDRERLIYDRAELQTWSRAWGRINEIVTKALS